MPARSLAERLALAGLLLGLLAVLAAAGAAAAPRATPTLEVGAIPDQDPQRLQRIYGPLADFLARKLGVEVEYRPVTDYTAAVTAFKVGDLDLVWFGGLTGVQARLQVPGAKVLAQRDIDARFHSVFIASTRSGLQPVDGVAGLAELKGHTFTFGSESSTSGRTMPQYFLLKAGVRPEDFKGQPGFSGSHDATIALVQAGSYDAGVLNEQVWAARTAAGAVDLTKVRVILRTPGYHDYHWLIRPDADRRFGKGFSDRVKRVLLGLNHSNAAAGQILDLFGARHFIPSKAGNYRQIEDVGRALGLIR